MRSREFRSFDEVSNPAQAPFTVLITAADTSVEGIEGRLTPGNYVEV